MAQSLLRQRLRIARLFGIDLFVHWTFGLVVLYVAYFSSGGGWETIGFALLQLAGMFTCVTLHEYGHALAARRYGIPTADITLLPIGGLARLGQMPRVPMQEFVVALAGPAVNVVIVLLLTGVMLLVTGGEMVSLDILSTPSPISFLLLMILVNTVLVLFNMIPSFPMDGGRVLRSILAMMMNYQRATFLASRLGLMLAVGMAWTALSTNPPNFVLVGISVFIAFAGMSEARQVEVVESVRGIRAGEYVIAVENPISIDDCVGDVVARWRNESAPVLPIVSGDRIVVGSLSLKQLTKAIESGIDERTTAGQLVDHRGENLILNSDERLEETLQGHGSGPRWIPVADSDHRLLGMLHLDTFLMRRRLSQTTMQTSEERVHVSPSRIDTSV